MVRVRHTNGEIEEYYISGTTDLDDFLDACEVEEDDKVWYQNSDGRWSIVEETWDEFVKLAGDCAMGDDPLRAHVMRRFEWEREDAEDLAAQHEMDFADTVSIN